MPMFRRRAHAVNAMTAMRHDYAITPHVTLMLFATLRC